MIDVWIEIPWYPCLSKNRSHYKARNRDRATIVAQEDIAYSVRQRVPVHAWDLEKRINVTLMVYYAREGTDPHNFAPAILDALEQGTGVNDKMMKPLTVDGRKFHKGEKPGFKIHLVQE